MKLLPYTLICNICHDIHYKFLYKGFQEVFGREIRFTEIYEQNFVVRTTAVHESLTILPPTINIRNVESSLPPFE